MREIKGPSPAGAIVADANSSYDGVGYGVLESMDKALRKYDLEIVVYSEDCSSYVFEIVKRKND